jgi:hypothetical protein
MKNLFDRHKSRRRAGVSMAASLAVICLTLFSMKAAFAPHPVQAQSPKIDNHNLIVRGYIVAVPAAKEQLATVAVVRSPVKEIYLPGVDVYLSEPQTAKTSNTVRTDLSGRFTVTAPERGRYQICWKSPVYGAGCNPGFVSVGASPQFVSSVRISLPPRAGFTAISGHVTNGDDEIPRTFDPFMNINAFARVAMEDGKNRPVEVYVNNFGDYLLPYVPVKQRLKLVAAIESARAGQEILPEANIAAASFNRVNFKFANHKPHLDPLLVFDSSAGKRVQNAAPGSKVIVEAKGRDLDGDPVQYAWSVSDGQGTLVQATGGKAEWQLPNAPGRYVISVVAYDGKGGYDKAALNVLATGKGIPFGGIVVDAGGTPIGGAEITIVGNPPVKTLPDGRFQTQVKESDRYVFNIHKEGFALNSRVYDRGIVAGRWILHRADVITVDPTQNITLVHERTERDCPGPDSVHAGLGVAGASLNIPEWQDGNGNAMDPPAWWTGPRKTQNANPLSVSATERAAAAAGKKDSRSFFPGNSNCRPAVRA